MILTVGSENRTHREKNQVQGVSEKRVQFWETVQKVKILVYVCIETGNHHLFFIAESYFFQEST